MFGDLFLEINSYSSIPIVTCNKSQQEWVNEPEKHISHILGRSLGAVAFMSKYAFIAKREKNDKFFKQA